MEGGAAGRATGAAEAPPSIVTAAARALMPAMARSRSLLMFAVTCDMRSSSIMDVRSYGGSEAAEADTAPAAALWLLERSAFLRRGDEDCSGAAGAVSAASAAAAALAASTAAATAAARSIA